MFQECVQPAITHQSLARECVACLSGPVEEHHESLSQLGADTAVRVQADMLRQLCSYPTTAGKFVSMAMHGASKLEPSCWVNESHQDQQHQQHPHGIHQLATLFKKIEALCAEAIASSADSHKRRRLSGGSRTAKMLELSARESKMLQQAKEACL